MTAIHRTDLLQVTAQTCGTVLLTLTMSGVSTLSDVFRQVRSSAPADAGIVTVKLRNRTQGWTQRPQSRVPPRPVRPSQSKIIRS